MVKQKLILCSCEFPDCSRFSNIFNTEYETVVAKSEREFSYDIYNLPADGAIICFCTAREDNVNKLLRLHALAGPIAVIACSKKLNPAFIRRASQQGVERFLLCDRIKFLIL